MTERTRTNWKAKHDALSVELDQAKRDLQDARTERDQLSNGLRASHQMLDALKREVERAKLIGARDLANVMLSGDSE